LVFIIKYERYKRQVINPLAKPYKKLENLMITEVEKNKTYMKGLIEAFPENLTAVLTITNKLIKINL